VYLLIRVLQVNVLFERFDTLASTFKVFVCEFRFFIDEVGIVNLRGFHVDSLLV
jgi:hypothetical protein